MKYGPYVVLCCLMVGIGTLAFGGKRTGNESPFIRSIPKLASLKSDERMRLLEQVSGEFADVKSGLISQLDESDPKAVIFSVAFLLGTFREEQSVHHLSKFIAIKSDRPLLPDRRMPIWGDYPVVEALISIGNRAIPEMLKNIESSDDEKVRELSAKVIRYVDGPEIAKFRLEKAIERQSDPAKKARLTAAMESIKEKR